MIRFAVCVFGAGLLCSNFLGCASETREVRESSHEGYRNVEQETPETPGERRRGPIQDRAGAQWDW